MNHRDSAVVTFVGSTSRPGAAAVQQVDHGEYGSVAVAGHTLGQLPAVIAEHLNHAGAAGAYMKLDVQVNLIAYNSKAFYVMIKGQNGDSVYRFPATGGETVVGAIFKTAADVVIAAMKGRVSLARLSGELLKVDWRAITQQGKSDTNYLIRSGDRVIVESSLPQ